MVFPDHGLYARSFHDVYDTWYGDLDDPAHLVESWRDRVAPGARIVEFGSGTGRLATPLSRAGFAVIALDVSLDMLQCAPAGPDQMAGDMAAVGLRSGCATGVLIAYNTFFNLAGREQQQRCVDEAARLLAPDGLLAIEGFIAPQQDRSAFGISSRPHPADPLGRVVIITGPAPEGPDDALIGSHVEQRAGRTICRPWSLAYCSPAQLDDLASRSGLVLVGRGPDWATRGNAPCTERHISWYRAG